MVDGRRTSAGLRRRRAAESPRVSGDPGAGRGGRPARASVAKPWRCLCRGFLVHRTLERLPRRTM